jgi:hypothetical protein
MTEEEAKTKWCPMAKNAGMDERGDRKNKTSYNRLNGKPRGSCMCVASDCMMWEPYEYWENKSGAKFIEDGKFENRRRIVGGNCGLKRCCE